MTCSRIKFLLVLLALASISFAETEDVYVIKASAIDNINNDYDIRAFLSVRSETGFERLTNEILIHAHSTVTGFDWAYEASTEPLIYLSYYKPNGRGGWTEQIDITLNLLPHCKFYDVDESVPSGCELFLWRKVGPFKLLAHCRKERIEY